MKTRVAPERRPVGARERRVEPVDVAQDLEITALQHRAAVLGPGRFLISVRIFVLMNDMGGERETQPAEDRRGAFQIGNEPADMVEEDLARPRRLSGRRRHLQSSQTSSQLP